MKITSREDFDRWQLEAKQISDQLDRIERAERAILEELRCPADPVTIYAILNGKQPAPWPKRTAKRDVQRAKLAMFALLFTSRTRSYLGPDPEHENPRLAAYYALQAGACAGDVVLKAKNEAYGASERLSQAAKGRKRGAQIAESAKRNDNAIKKLVRQWRESDELQEAHGYRHRCRTSSIRPASTLERFSTRSSA